MKLPRCSRSSPWMRLPRGGPCHAADWQRPTQRGLMVETVALCQPWRTADFTFAVHDAGPSCGIARAQPCTRLVRHTYTPCHTHTPCRVVISYISPRLFQRSVSLQHVKLVPTKEPVSLVAQAGSPAWHEAVLEHAAVTACDKVSVLNSGHCWILYCPGGKASLHSAVPAALHEPPCANWQSKATPCVKLT